MSFVDDFRSAMTLVASKNVTRTDVNKGAYVPNQEQRNVMSRAGYQPEPHENERLIDIIVAGSAEILQTSYYPSVRRGSGRQPEIRMGRGLTHWLNEGETVWLGTDDKNVFALKSSLPHAFTEESEEIELANEQLGSVLDIDLASLVKKVDQLGGLPNRRETRSSVFERNPLVKAFARLRSKCRCEMPACDYVGFKKPDGSLYIEVHHIKSMAKDGHDVIQNVAALCPNCHKMAHYSCDRVEIESKLINAIQKANAILGLKLQ